MKGEIIAAVAARKLGIPKNTVYHWIKCGWLEASRRGRNWHIPMEDYELCKEVLSGTLTTGEAAYQLGIGLSTLTHWLGAEKIKGVKLGGQWYVRQGEIDRVKNELRKGN